jgi:hypothetical protein
MRTGPDADGVAADFAEIFQEQLHVDGGVFLFAHESEVQADLMRRAALRGNFSVPLLGEMPQVTHVMPPGMCMRYQAHDEVRKAESAEAEVLIESFFV